MRTNHLRERLHLRDAQRPLPLPILREQRTNMFDQTVKRQRELPDLIAAPGIDLYGEIITAARTSHCCRKHVKRPPEMLTQAIGKICRHTECSGIRYEHDAEERIECPSVHVLRQTHRNMVCRTEDDHRGNQQRTETSEKKIDK